MKIILTAVRIFGLLFGPRYAPVEVDKNHDWGAFGERW
jgi:hypothetical protein